MVKKEENVFKFVDGSKQQGKRDSYLEFKHLIAGQYLMGVEIDWNNDVKWDKEFALNCYGI
jgi:hypothetical protein